MRKTNSVVKKFISPKALACIVLALPALQALADDETQLPAPVPLSDYIATPAPKPTWKDQVKLPFPSHLYLKAQVGYQTTNAGNVSNSSQTPTPALNSGNSLSQNSVTGNFALGYQFHNSGLLTRAEIAYMLPQTLSTSSNPAYNGLDSGLKASVQTQSLLFKIYNDFAFDNFPVIPYIEGGIGAAYNKSSVNSNININIDAGPEQFVIPTQASANTSNTAFAWDLGAGTRYRFGNSNFYLDVGYEYQSLGQGEKWNLNYNQPDFGNLFQVNLQTENIHSNVILAGLYWQPFAINLNDTSETAD